MVDFNNETIVNAPARKIITIIYLQRSEWLQDAWEEYYSNEGINVENSSVGSKIKARLISLFKRLKPSLKKSLPDDKYKAIEYLVQSDSISKWEEASDILEQFLYEKNITRIDTTKPYDPTDIEEENLLYGL